MSSDLAAEGDPLDVHRHGTGPARFRHCSFRDPPGPVLPRLIPPLRHRAWAPVYIRRRMLRSCSAARLATDEPTRGQTHRVGRRTLPPNPGPTVWDWISCGRTRSRRRSSDLWAHAVTDRQTWPGCLGPGCPQARSHWGNSIFSAVA
jgi:hypothetical protein